MRRSLLRFLLIISLPVIVFAQVTEKWVARYNGPGDSLDCPTSLAVGNSGNVYVTGYSWDGPGTGVDYATIKYNSVGAEQWVARYHGPGDGYDVPYSTVVGYSDNIYVTGYSDGGDSTGYDYATIKYNSAGVKQWVARYDGPGTGSDGATAMAVDNSDNVYVTGSSDGGSANDYDYATIKYNSAGVKQWVARYNGPGTGADGATAMTVDYSANVYVTGSSYGGLGTDYDYTTIKYNSAGVTQWVTRYNGPGNGADGATAMTVDYSANVYVTGSSFGGSDTDDDYATIKYDSAGIEQWVTRYNGPGDRYDVPYSIAVDNAGNVYVTGYSWRSDSYHSSDYLTIKYNSAGVKQWVARYNGPMNDDDGAFSLALDKSGNVYVTGSSWSSSSYKGSDYATIKYNSDGVRQWIVRYDGPAHLADEAKAVAVDKSGNVYVIGYSCDSLTSRDYATFKYSQSTDIGETTAPRPARYILEIPRPNPTSGCTEVRYSLPVSEQISLAVYEITGKLIKTLAYGTETAGSKIILWTGRDNSDKPLPNGLYFIRLETARYSATRKIVLVR